MFTISFEISRTNAKGDHSQLMSLAAHGLHVSHNAFPMSPHAMVNGPKATLHECRDGKDICGALRHAVMPLIFLGKIHYSYTHWDI